MGRKVVMLARRLCVGVVKAKCGEPEVGVVYCGETINREGVRLGWGV